MLKDRSLIGLFSYYSPGTSISQNPRKILVQVIRSLFCHNITKSTAQGDSYLGSF